MNRNDFLSLIENSGPSDRNMIGEVSELISIFPYFQSAYLLLLKGLQNTDDVKFENQLRSSALHIANREVLYYFLKKENTPFEKTKTLEEEHVAPVTDFSGSQQTVIESAMNSQDLINEIERNQVDVHQGGIKVDHSILVSSETLTDEFGASVLLIDEESGDVEEKYFYMDPGFTVSDKTDLLELDIDEENSSGEEIKRNDPDTSGSTDSKKQFQSELIDKFIVSNPRIVPVREKTGIPVEDISKPFIEEQGGFVTETLARIYLTQEYYSKAIDIYEKLSLKFPEKSSYFATQIEKVKELIKK